MTQQVAFAVPGKLTRLTGGTIYDRRVIDELRAAGMDVQHLELPASFPAPSPDEMQETLAQLAAVPAGVPLIIDGLAFGALDTEGVAQLRAPLVALVHHPLAEESGLDEARRAHLFETERRNLQWAKHVLVPSPHTASILVEKYSVSESATTIAQPGTDQPSLAGNPVKPPLILSVGIQTPRKGHDVLIKALAKLQDLNWQAVIAGAPVDAPFAQELARLSDSAGLGGRLNLAGQIEQDALQRLYAKASLFALATRYEGYGIVFDEALVHGVPIVSCATGAVPDTVPKNAGLLTSPDDPGAFADALRTLLSDGDQCKACAWAAKTAGQALPSWADTASIVASAMADIHLEDAG